MKLKISHITEYHYADPIINSINEIRLTPSTNERQSCYNHTITVEPNALLFNYEDGFGNKVHAFSIIEPHKKLTIKSTMTIVTTETFNHSPKRKRVRTNHGDAWELIKTDKFRDQFIEYLIQTPYTTTSEDIDQLMEQIPTYTLISSNEQQPLTKISIHEWVDTLVNHIRTHFVYDPEATTVNTTPIEMIASKRGVCQDFAHLMITICRARGIPARYVSGYHFVGDLQSISSEFEQASHAWVEAYIPEQGWISFDPTNFAAFDERYVKIGHGRDYNDIVPVKGIYLGTSEQYLSVVVDVQKIVE